MSARLASFTFGALALCGGGALAPAAAQQPPTSAAQSPPRTACRADFQKFCADVHPGSGRVAQCLLAHKSALSPACRDSLSKVGAQNADKSEPGKSQ